MAQNGAGLAVHRKKLSNSSLNLLATPPLKSATLAVKEVLVVGVKLSKRLNPSLLAAGRVLCQRLPEAASSSHIKNKNKNNKDVVPKTGEGAQGW